MTIEQTRRTPAATGTGAAGLIAIGAVAGLCWAAGLRGFMVGIAGPASTFDWVGTFEGILLPGAVTGALLGWAEHLRRTGDRPYRRWLALAPLSFVAATPWVLVSVVVDGGLGGGAIGLPLVGIAGGYALAGRRTWLRVPAGIVALVGVLGAPVAGALAGFADPRGAWLMVLLGSSVAVLALACAVPFRPAVTAAAPPPATSPTGT